MQPTCSRSNRDLSSRPLPAAREMTVGGSWLGSPTRMMRPVGDRWRRGMRVAGSRACVGGRTSCQDSFNDPAGNKNEDGVGVPEGQFL